MNKEAAPAHEYFLQQHALCLKFLRAYNIKKSAEGLHQVRVSVKKIKAVLLMLNQLNKDFDFDQAYAPYKNIFRHIAPIREYLLQNEQLKGDDSSKTAKRNTAAIAKMSQDLKRAIPGYLKAVKTTLPAITDNLQKLDPETVYPYCQKLLKHLKSKWKHVSNDDELHGFRKQVKQILYCSKLLSAQQRDKLLSTKKIDLMDKLQDQIGQWHDNVILLDRIKNDNLHVSLSFIRVLKSETRLLHKKARKTGAKL